MARVIWIEVLDQRGAVKDRVRVETVPASIGRSLANDIVLDDPYVDARHADLGVDDAGGVVVRDLGSVNGLRHPTASGKVAVLPLPPGGSVRIGRTILRLVDPALPVPAALMDGDGPRSRIAVLTTTRGQLVAVALALAYIVVEGWLGTSERLRFVKLLSNAVLAFVGLALWSGIWSIASRIVVKHTRFLSHLAWVSAIVVGFRLLNNINEWVMFIVPTTFWTSVSGTVLAITLVTVLTYGHLRLVVTVPSRRLWRPALVVGVAMQGLLLLAGYASHEDFSSRLEYSGFLKPLGPRWVWTIPLDDFIQSSQQLKAKVDRIAQSPP